MNKFDRKVMVVQRATLLDPDEFQGFRLARDIDYRSRILSSYTYMRRGDAEEDERYKQPICCAIVVNRANRTVFVCQKMKNASESRLHGTWSCCIGGHIEEEDERGLNGVLEHGFIRERDEELVITSPPPIQLFGYLNDDSSAVSRVHFGVMYLIPLDSPDCTLRDETLSHGSFHALEELEAICVLPHNVIDDWARFMIAPIREYFFAL